MSSQQAQDLLSAANKPLIGLSTIDEGGSSSDRLEGEVDALDAHLPVDEDTVVGTWLEHHGRVATVVRKILNRSGTTGNVRDEILQAGAAAIAACTDSIKALEACSARFADATKDVRGPDDDEGLSSALYPGEELALVPVEPDEGNEDVEDPVPFAWSIYLTAAEKDTFRLYQKKIQSWKDSIPTEANDEMTQTTSAILRHVVTLANARMGKNPTGPLYRDIAFHVRWYDSVLDSVAQGRRALDYLNNNSGQESGSRGARPKQSTGSSDQDSDDCKGTSVLPRVIEVGQAILRREANLRRQYIGEKTAETIGKMDEFSKCAIEVASATEGDQGDRPPLHFHKFVTNAELIGACTDDEDDYSDGGEDGVREQAKAKLKSYVSALRDPKIRLEVFEETRFKAKSLLGIAVIVGNNLNHEVSPSTVGQIEWLEEILKEEDQLVDAIRNHPTYISHRLRAQSELLNSSDSIMSELVARSIGYHPDSGSTLLEPSESDITVTPASTVEKPVSFKLLLTSFLRASQLS